MSGSILRILNLNSAEGVINSGQSGPAIVKNAAVIRPVNINTASSRDLESIPGIGVVIASRIIGYREKFGNFGSWEDLKNVKGIGDKKIEALKNQVVFR